MSAKNLLRTAALCAVLVRAAPLAAQEGRSQIDTTFAFNPSGEINLSLAAGDIRVTAWAKNEARIVVAGERGTLSTSFSQNRVRVETRAHGGASVRARYDITVPIGVRVSASALTGTINVSGTRGSLSLTTMSGAITASDGKGRLDFETGSGTVVLQRLEGTTHVTALGGTISIDEISGDLEMEALANGARVERAALANFRFEAAAGNLRFSGTLAPDGKHSIETFAGKVTLHLPAGAGLTLDFGTLSGSIKSTDFPVTLSPSGGSGRGHNSEHQLYMINDGGARLGIETLTGDVVLVKLGAPTRR